MDTAYCNASDKFISIMGMFRLLLCLVNQINFGKRIDLWHKIKYLDGYVIKLKIDRNILLTKSNNVIVIR